mmetsp:Transcript_17790/g.31344  ORF Transcript_17790/g.31344 Transcript_17790/m.31344 type:complete len:84 (-) Transcript_17790:277-528(-)
MQFGQSPHTKKTFNNEAGVYQKIVGECSRVHKPAKFESAILVKRMAISSHLTTISSLPSCHNPSSKGVVQIGQTSPISMKSST